MAELAKQPSRGGSPFSSGPMHLELLIGHTIVDAGYGDDVPLTVITMKDGQTFQTQLFVNECCDVGVFKQTRLRECDEA